MSKMIKICKNCGSELEEGSLFCTECGMRVDEDEIKEAFENVLDDSDDGRPDEQENDYPETGWTGDDRNASPYAQEIIYSDDEDLDSGREGVFREEPDERDYTEEPAGGEYPEGSYGYRAQESEDDETYDEPVDSEADYGDYDDPVKDPDKKGFLSKLPLRKILIIAGGVLAAAVLIVLGVLFLPKFLNKKEAHKSYNRILYIKDNELFTSGKKENTSWQVTSRRLLEDDEELYSTNPYIFYDFLVKTSWDEKTVFYPDRLTVEDGFSLYLRSLVKEKEEDKKIDSGIENFYSINEDGSKVAYVKRNSSDNNYTLYVYDVKSAEKNKISSKLMSQSFYFSKDGKRLIFLDSDSRLYSCNLSGKSEKYEPERLDSNVSYFKAVSSDCRMIFYVKNETELCFKKENEDRIKLTSMLDQYLPLIIEEGYAYYVVMDEDSKEKTLYYFDGKNNEAICELGADNDKYRSRIGQYSEEGIPLVLFSDSDGEIKIAVGNKVFDFDYLDSENYKLKVASDGCAIAFIDDYGEDGGELSVIRISAQKDGYAISNPESYGDFVNSIDDIINGDIYYIKDVTDSESVLMVNKEVLADNGKNSFIWTDERKALFLTDVVNSFGTLYMYDGKKTIKISDDVYDNYAMARFLPDGNVLYLKDYNKKTEEGDMYLFDGKKSIRLAQDVSEVIWYH